MSLSYNVPEVMTSPKARERGLDPAISPLLKRECLVGSIRNGSGAPSGGKSGGIEESATKVGGEAVTGVLGDKIRHK